LLLPGIQFIPVIERIVNDAASVVGIAALLLALIKKKSNPAAAGKSAFKKKSI
jgi:hypothetical protein